MRVIQSFKHRYQCTELLPWRYSTNFIKKALYHHDIGPRPAICMDPCIPLEGHISKIPVICTYDNRIRRLAVNWSAISKIRSIGNLVMPFFHFNAEADNFSYIEVERPFFVFPDPDLVLVITASRQPRPSRDCGRLTI